MNIRDLIKELEGLPDDVKDGPLTTLDAVLTSIGAPFQSESQIVFPNGLRAIHVDHIEKDVVILIPEGWGVIGLPTDSGLSVHVETKPFPYKDYPGTAKITVKRMQPPPGADDPNRRSVSDTVKEARRS